MSRNPRTVALLIILQAVAVIAQSKTSSACGISIYWGQTGSVYPNDYVSTLKEACDTGTFKIINLAHLDNFGGGQIPVMNLTGICDQSSGGTCVEIAEQIDYCQRKGIKVLLSLGGANGKYSLTSEDDAVNVADYLWNTFLSGGTTESALGSVRLDGIDFDIEGGSNLYWDDLARHLKAKDQNVFLSAAPQCTYPDYYLGEAIDTGLFDAVWVKFYNNPSCEYRFGNTYNLINSWNYWTVSVNADVYLGLPASPSDVNLGGFIPDTILNSVVLPVINTTPKYGGVMLWSRYYDPELEGYSASIKSPCVLGDGLGRSSS